MIDAAVKSGVKRFIPSEFGSNIENQKTASLLSMLYVDKQATVAYLRKLENVGLIWTSIATGPWFDL